MLKTAFLPLFLIIMGFHAVAQEWQTPTIEGYGRIVDFDSVAVTPNPNMEYKLLFHITSEKEREGVNDNLWKIARLLNLLENGGVAENNIHVVAVISGKASPITLSGNAYLKKMGKPNPNLDLMEKLTDHGVIIHLCGQAAAEHNIDPKMDLNPYTKLTLSALIDIPTYQMQGYVVMF